MGTFPRQTQIQNSQVYSDGITPTALTFETDPTNAQEDLNNLRSQVNNLLNAQTGNWYDNPFGGGDPDLPITGLNLVPISCFVDQLSVVTVTAGQNWQVLSAPGETPSKPISLTNDTEGAIVAAAELPAGFNVFSLAERAGGSAISPNNLLLIRDSSTGEAIQSSGRDVFGLLQVTGLATDGDTFDNVSNAAKISFVRLNGTLDGLEAVPIPDIENRSIQYNYASVVFFKNLDPSCFTGGRGFIDQATAVDVTLQNAYNGGNSIITSGPDITFTGQVGDGAFQVSMGDGITLLSANQTTPDTDANGIDIGTGQGDGTGDGGNLSIGLGPSGTGATGDGGSVAIGTGAALSTDGAGGQFRVVLGASTGNVDGPNIFLAPGESAGGSGASGTLVVSPPNTNTEPVTLFQPTGGGSVDFGLYSGSGDPNGVVTADRGSLYVRATGASAELWQNTDDATAWALFMAGAPPAETRQETYDNQLAVAVVTTTDAILNVGANFEWNINDAGGGSVFSVTEDSGANQTAVNVGPIRTFESQAETAIFTCSDGFSVDTSAGTGPIVANAASDIRLSSAQEIELSVTGGPITAQTTQNIQMTAGTEIVGDADDNVRFNAVNGSLSLTTASQDFLLGGVTNSQVSVGSGSLALTAAQQIQMTAGTSIIGQADEEIRFVASTGSIALLTDDDGGDDIFAAAASTTNFAANPPGNITLNAGQSTGAVGLGVTGGGAFLASAGDSEQGVGADATIAAGNVTGGTGSGGVGGNVILLPGQGDQFDGSVASGFVRMFGDGNREQDKIAELETGSTNGAAADLLVGTSDPTNSIDAKPGSLFFRNQGALGPGELYLNVSAVAGVADDWEQIATGSGFSRTTGQAPIPSDTAANTAILLTGFTDIGGGTFPATVPTGNDFVSRVEIYLNGIRQVTSNQNSATPAGTSVATNAAGTSLIFDSETFDTDVVTIVVSSA